MCVHSCCPLFFIGVSKSLLLFTGDVSQEYWYKLPSKLKTKYCRVSRKEVSFSALTEKAPFQYKFTFYEISRERGRFHENNYSKSTSKIYLLLELLIFEDLRTEDIDGLLFRLVHCTCPTVVT